MTSHWWVPAPACSAGSLNASAAQWLIGTGRFHAPYVASQGTAMGRAGRVFIDTDTTGQVWVGGDAVTCVGPGVPPL